MHSAIFFGLIMERKTRKEIKLGSTSTGKHNKVYALDISLKEIASLSYHKLKAM